MAMFGNNTLVLERKYSSILSLLLLSSLPITSVCSRSRNKFYGTKSPDLEL